MSTSHDRRKKGQRSAQRGATLAPVHETGSWKLTTNEITFGLTKLEAPSQTMVANMVATMRRGPDVIMLFGHELPPNGAVSAALLIEMPAHDLARILGGVDEHGRDFVAKSRIQAEQLDPNGMPSCREFALLDLPRDRSLVERANFGVFAFLGGEAEMRFYRISANDVQAVRRGEKPQLIYPVVQVVLSVSHLTAMLERVNVLVEPELRRLRESA